MAVVDFEMIVLNGKKSGRLSISDPLQHFIILAEVDYLLEEQMMESTWALKIQKALPNQFLIQ